jgi:hypothetical protein
VRQVFLKHINDDGGMRNVEMKTKGPNVTPRAEDVSTDVAEVELLMTSGQTLLSMIMFSEEFQLLFQLFSPPQCILLRFCSFK